MIETRDLHKHYLMGDSVVNALDGVDLRVDAGEFLAITGASGSGKSTLMHLLGGLDRPTSGSLFLRGKDVSAMSELELASLRNQEIGFVFQTFNLINRSTALENVCVPLMYTRRSFSSKTALSALDRVGLQPRSKHTPSEMSGGECQRVAIARAIVNHPSLLLADEPTGNLDTRTSEQILNIFHELHAGGMTIVLVTHEIDVALQSDRIVHMKDGRIDEDTVVDDTRRAEILQMTRQAHDTMFSERSAAKANVEGQPLPAQAGGKVDPLRRL